MRRVGSTSFPPQESPRTRSKLLPLIQLRRIPETEDGAVYYYSARRPRRGDAALPERQRIKRIALSVPTDLGQPFATWSLAKLADYLVAEGVVADISQRGSGSSCARRTSAFKR